MGGSYNRQLVLRQRWRSSGGRYEVGWWRHRVCVCVYFCCCSCCCLRSRITCLIFYLYSFFNKNFIGKFLFSFFILMNSFPFPYEFICVSSSSTSDSEQLLCGDTSGGVAGFWTSSSLLLRLRFLGDRSTPPLGKGRSSYVLSLWLYFLGSISFSRLIFIFFPSSSLFTATKSPGRALTRGFFGTVCLRSPFSSLWKESAIFSSMDIVILSSSLFLSHSSFSSLSLWTRPVCPRPPWRLLPLV